MSRRPGLPHITGVAALVACLNACGSSLDNDARVRTDTLTVADTVVTTASALIGGVADLAIGPDGRLFIMDSRSHQVLSVRPNGDDARAFGREGEGPGEFSRAWELSVGSDRVWVYDRGLGRVQEFRLNGELVGGYAVAAPRIGGRAALDSHGRIALPMAGHDSIMIAVVDSSGERIAGFGEPIVPPTSFFDFGAIKAVIREGRIPDAFRNDATIVAGRDGSIWLVFQSEPEVRRYGEEGRLLWTTRLDGSAIKAARATFFEENIAEERPSVIHRLSYAAAAAAVAGDLWLLLESAVDGGGVLLVLDGADGHVRRRLILSGIAGADDIAVDRERGRLYVTLGGVAAIVAVDLTG